MRTIKKILLFRQENICNDLLNTLTDYVAEQLRCRKIEYDFIDISKEQGEVLKDMERTISGEFDAALAFNAMGQQDVMINGENIYDHYGIPFYNYIVDHPMDHFGALQSNCENYHVICMDRDHVDLIRDYFPNIRSAHFLPLGAVPVKSDKRLAVREREYDIVFTGGYLPQRSKDLLEVFEGYPDPQRTILLKLIERLLEKDSLDIRGGLKEVLLELYGIQETEPDEVLNVMRAVQGANLFMRTYVREQVLQQLMRTDLSFHIFGNGWKERMATANPGMSFHPGVPFGGTGEIFDHAKIVLNIMPWFKNGTHDRIASAMLHGAVALTDHSRYLDELPDDIMFCYEIMKPEQLEAQIREMLNNEKELQSVADRGFRYAKTHMTWEQNVSKLMEIMGENL